MKEHKRKVTVVFEINNLPEGLKLQSALNAYVEAARKISFEPQNEQLRTAIRTADAHITKIGVE